MISKPQRKTSFTGAAGLLSALALAAFVLACGPARAGVFTLPYQWDTRAPLRVCFFGGSPQTREQIADLANDWTPGTSIVFDFGPAGRYHSCGDGRFDIRVGFRGDGFWSKQGALARKEPADRPTLNLEGLERGVPANVRHQVWRVFGHALGLWHEEQDPISACTREIDVQAIRRETGFPREDREKNVVPVVADDGRYVLTAYDRRSVMRQFTDPADFRQGRASPCFGPPATQISAGDRGLIQRVYPARPADISSRQTQPLASVRIEGVHAAEHLGHVLNALHDRGFIRYRKLVDTRGVHIRDIVVDLGLAPRGRISESYERYLCKINPHICVTRVIGGTIEWRNEPAKRNFEADIRECVDQTLDTSVFCVPNIRLETYNTLREIHYSPKQGSLEELVVRDLGGCQRWNEECRSMVRRLNRDIPDRQFLPNGEMAASFSGELLLPTVGFRIPVDYARPGRPALERAIAAVVSDRARALQVKEDDVAIRLSDPIGDPVVQATILSEPAPGYADALRIMSYPFVDEESEAELRSWPAVHVAVWDTHVQRDHCEFQRSGASIISSTLSGRSTDEVPPKPAATQCAQARAQGYKPSKRWEHGTSVTGLIAAQVNGQGIAGAYPMAKLWAWELLSGDQFNTDPNSNPRQLMLQYPDLDPVVVNISQTFRNIVQGRSNEMEYVLFGRGNQRGMHGRMLFVAAAGLTAEGSKDIGKKADTASECTAFPACWSSVESRRRNFISVVALNRQGTDILKLDGEPATNYGAAFDVAAVGETQTTMHGNWIGGWMGSSFAAPYVTSLAALLFSKAKSKEVTTPPRLIKERILATADRHPAPLHESSRFGRINFARALRFENDFVVLNDPAAQPLTGVIDRGGRIIAFRQHTTNPPEKVEIEFINLRRVISDGNNLYTVYSVREGRLQKHERMAFASPDETIEIPTADGTAGFRLSQIRDMTMCSIVPECGGAQ